MRSQGRPSRDRQRWSRVEVTPAVAEAAVVAAPPASAYFDKTKVAAGIPTLPAFPPRQPVPYLLLARPQAYLLQLRKHSAIAYDRQEIHKAALIPVPVLPLPSL